MAVRTMSATLRQLLEWTIAAVEAATHGDDSTRTTRYVRLDHLDQLEHMGVYVWSPRSSNAETVAEVADAWITDAIEVVLAIQVARTPGQTEMLLRVGDHEETLRNAVCTYEYLLPHQPVWTDAVRELSEDHVWLTSRSTFRMRRLEAVRS
jgi:hypothetical protein